MPPPAPPVYIIPEEGLTVPAPIVQSVAFIFFPIIAAISLYIPLVFVGYLFFEVAYRVLNHLNNKQQNAIQQKASAQGLRPRRIPLPD